MEHIIQFGVTIDDEAIQNQIMESAEKQIIGDISEKVKRGIFKQRNIYGGYGKSVTELSDIGKEVVKEVVKDWLNDHADRVIELAAKEVADRVFRSKKWKEKYGEVTADDNS